MQVGSPQLASGTAHDQFQNYISALKNHAPETFAAMNQAQTPEGVYAAQHTNADWRMGIPGGRFDYARQVMSAPGETGAPSRSQFLTSGTPAAQGSALAMQPTPGGYQSGTGSNLPQMSSLGDYAKALTTPGPTQVVGGAIAQGLQNAGKQVAANTQTPLPGMNNNPFMAILQQLVANPTPYFRS
jgi:hypothetical protein